MSGEERIRTLNPLGKRGTYIERDTYETVKSAILKILTDHGPTRFMALTEAVNEELGERYRGSLGWYFTTVKLDLEARGLIVCDRKEPEQVIQLPGS